MSVLEQRINQLDALFNEHNDNFLAHLHSSNPVHTSDSLKERVAKAKEICMFNVVLKTGYILLHISKLNSHIKLVPLLNDMFMDCEMLKKFEDSVDYIQIAKNPENTFYDKLKYLFAFINKYANPDDYIFLQQKFTNFLI